MCRAVEDLVKKEVDRTVEDIVKKQLNEAFLQFIQSMSEQKFSLAQMTPHCPNAARTRSFQR